MIEEPSNMYNNTSNVRKRNCPKPTIFFKDNVRCVLLELFWSFSETVYFRSVDFVLVWNRAHENASAEEAHRKREIFQRNLCAKGLELEYEQGERGILNFVKASLSKSCRKKTTFKRV